VVSRRGLPERVDLGGPLPARVREVPIHRDRRGRARDRYRRGGCGRLAEPSGRQEEKRTEEDDPSRHSSSQTPPHAFGYEAWVKRFGCSAFIKASRFFLPPPIA